MNDNEIRCVLACELVRHSKAVFDSNGFCCCEFSKEEDALIRQEAADKLVSKRIFYKLLESPKQADEIAEELFITKQVLIDYLVYCKNKIINQSKAMNKLEGIKV
jgi:hypothetical protein